MPIFNLLLTLSNISIPKLFLLYCTFIWYEILFPVNSEKNRLENAIIYTKIIVIDIDIEPKIRENYIIRRKTI
ncbi:hypothetical protein CR513_14059, partial [Mucuna pruriens]